MNIKNFSTAIKSIFKTKTKEETNSKKNTIAVSKTGLKTKIILNFMLIVCFAILIFSIGFFSIMGDSFIGKVEKKIFPTAMKLTDLESDVKDIHLWLTNISATRAASGYDNGFNEAEKSYKKAQKKINELIEMAKKDVSQESITALSKMKDKEKEEALKKNSNLKYYNELISLKNRLDAFYATGVETARAYIEGGATYGNEMLTVFTQTQKDLSVPLNQLVDSHKDYLKKGVASIKNFLINLLFFGSIIIITISLFISMLLAKRLTRPLLQVIESLKDMSEGEGDLTAQIKITSKDEIGELSKYFNNFVKRICNVIAQVKGITGVLASASVEISNTAKDLSDSSSEQASSVEEILTTMTSIESAVSANTENAQNTDQLAQKAAEKSNMGKDAVEKTVESMEKISQKISIIEDVASQTNLLALNAAIEASRAGEYGKGFSVVASEVRKLAEKSQQSSKEIIDLVNEGAKVAANTGKIFEEIFPSVIETAELVQKIYRGSSEQKSGIEQINVGMDQLSEITQQSAATSEEMAATSASLNDQATTLKNLLDFFKVKSDENGPKGGIAEKNII